MRRLARTAADIATIAALVALLLVGGLLSWVMRVTHLDGRPRVR